MGYKSKLGGGLSTKIKTKKRWGKFAHHKNLIMWAGGRLATPVHKL